MRRTSARTVTEDELLARCRRGRHEAFAELVARYRARLFTYLLRFSGDRSAAEDHLQETLVKAWQGLGRYDHRGRFSAWLFRIAHNVTRDAGRRGRARLRLDLVEELPEPPAGDDPEADLLARELERSIRDRVARLPDKQRRVFLLRQHGDLSFKEIAALTDEPLSTVLGHMSYAVAKLRKALRSAS